MFQQPELPTADPHSDLQTASRYVAAVDIGGTNLRVAIADLRGNVIARVSKSTVGIRDASVVVRLICEAVRNLLQEWALPESLLVAIGAGAPGVVDVDNGIVIVTSYLMGWRNVPLRALLEEALGIPAAVDNDVNLAALGEGRAGVARGVKDFVFLAVGTGIGAGIIVNGNLVRGHGWSAGEIGYMLVPGVSEAPVSGDAPGALEELAGGEGIRSQWRLQWHEGKTLLPREAVASEIFDAAAQGDQLASEVLGAAARALAYALYNIWLVLNCELFVLGGSLCLNPLYMNTVAKMLAAQSTRTKSRLVVSELGSDAQLLGAVFIAIDLVSK